MMGTVPQAQNFEAAYRREYGVHNFTIADGTPVSALSFPTWEEFYEQLIDLPETGGYVISPELITLPGPLAGNRPHKQEILDRIISVAQISRQHPEAMFLLGSASFDGSDIMWNSLVVIRDGLHLGNIDKKGMMWPAEAKEFSRLRREQAELLNVGHAALVCSDIIHEATHAYPNISGYLYISEDTETIVLSSCWAVPQSNSPFLTSSPDERYGTALENVMGRLFARYPHLRDIVVVDRAIPEVGNQPYTGYFKSTVRGR